MRVRGLRGLVSCGDGGGNCMMIHLVRRVRVCGCCGYLHGIGSKVRGANKAWVCVQRRALGGAARLAENWRCCRSGCGSCSSSGCSVIGVATLWTRRWHVFTGVVFLDLEKVLLGMRANLDDVLGLDVLLDLLPVASVFLKGVDKGLMLLSSPVFAILGDDVGLSRFLGGDGVGDEGGGGDCGVVEMRGDGERMGSWDREVLWMKWGGDRRGDGDGGMSEWWSGDWVGTGRHVSGVQVGRKVVGAHLLESWWMDVRRFGSCWRTVR